MWSKLKRLFRRHRVWSHDAEGWATSAGGERYRVTVEPGDGRFAAVGQVVIAVHVGHHPWLSKMAAVYSDLLAVKAEPEDVDRAMGALLRDADRRARAIRAAWERGWRP